MVYLDKEKTKKLIEHAQKESPNEACGLLAGLAKADEKARFEVKKIYEMTNTNKSATRFFMDPAEQLKVLKDIRSLGLQMVGIYHSHPHSKAYPSAHDVEMAFYPDVSYVIVSLEDKKNPRLKSFRIAEGKITEEVINS
ncbi:MAG: M67 family metallopeptidase [Omnitrophica bacterium]|nr:M67 family metallopeptidase [Candidatus Omnitrophota bacterium]